MGMLWKRVAALFRGRRLDGELEEEISSHLAMQEEEFRARGMSAAEARLAARREFGGVTQTVEAYRDRRMRWSRLLRRGYEAVELTVPRHGSSPLAPRPTRPRAEVRTLAPAKSPD